MSPKHFFAFARERHSMFLRRSAGLPGPWTTDPTLLGTRFTNVFRELDRTTIVLRKLIRDPLRQEPWVVPAVIIARWFNRIETLEVMAPFLVQEWPGVGSSYVHDIEEAIREAIPKGPWVTGSYMVCSGHGKGQDKLSGMLRYSRLMLDWWDREGRAFFTHNPRPSLQAAHQELVKLEGLAGFTAYEVVTDLRWTNAVNPHDRFDWAHAGPGATRGGSRVLFKEPDRLSQDSFKDQEKLRILMRRLLKMSREEKYWPQDNVEWPVWELREVEHTLCEFDKYERVRREQGHAKRTYKWVAAQPLIPSGLDL